MAGRQLLPPPLQRAAQAPLPPPPPVPELPMLLTLSLTAADAAAVTPGVRGSTSLRQLPAAVAAHSLASAVGTAHPCSTRQGRHHGRAVGAAAAATGGADPAAAAADCAGAAAASGPADSCAGSGAAAAAGAAIYCVERVHAR